MRTSDREAIIGEDDQAVWVLRAWLTGHQDPESFGGEAFRHADVLAVVETFGPCLAAGSTCGLTVDAVRGTGDLADHARYVHDARLGDATTRGLDRLAVACAGRVGHPLDANDDTVVDTEPDGFPPVGYRAQTTDLYAAVDWRFDNIGHAADEYGWIGKVGGWERPVVGEPERHALIARLDPCDGCTVVPGEAVVVDPIYVGLFETRKGAGAAVKGYPPFVSAAAEQERVWEGNTERNAREAEGWGVEYAEDNSAMVRVLLKTMFDGGQL
jgi:hypothetical protein